MRILIKMTNKIEKEDKKKLFKQLFITEKRQRNGEVNKGKRRGRKKRKKTVLKRKVAWLVRRKGERRKFSQVKVNKNEGGVLKFG